MTINPLNVEPWGATKPGYLNKGLKVLAITLIALAALTICAEITFIGLSLGRLLPQTGFWGWVGGLGSLRTFLIEGFAIQLLVVSSVTLYLRHKYNLRQARKAEQIWIQNQIAKNPDREGCVFKKEDKPVIPGLTWNDPDKLRALVISAEEGGGHKTAAKAVYDALKDKCFVKIIYPTGELNETEWFNWCQRGGWKKIQKALVNIQRLAEKLGVFAPVQEAINREMLLHKPQLIISVQPISNAVTAYFAKKYKIPFIVIPTDYKTNQFFYGTKESADNFRVALPFEDPDEVAQLKKEYNFEDRHLVVTGYPVRAAFQSSSETALNKSCIDLKMKYEIKEKDHVILASMGAQGGPELEKYCKQIAKGTFEKSTEKIHVFALCGNNQALLEKIKTIKSDNERIIFHPIGWINGDLEMAAFIKIASVYITKPGGASTSEGWALGTYLYFNGEDAKTTPWEPVNMKKAQEHGVGEEINNAKFLERLDELLSDPPIKKLASNEFPGRQFAENIQALVEELIPE